MSNKEEPEKLYEIFGCYGWSNKEEMVNDITNKLRELGYSTKDGLDSDIINVVCEHRKVCRIIPLLKESDGIWHFEDICDHDSILDRCQICRKRKTIAYMFDDDALKFWNKEDDPGDFDEIDLNDFISWDEVNDIAIKVMKDKFPKGTIFTDVDNE